jgi:hypothetical protein
MGLKVQSKQGCSSVNPSDFRNRYAKRSHNSPMIEPIQETMADTGNMEKLSV